MTEMKVGGLIHDERSCMLGCMDIDPALLRALAAVKQTGGFTQAAARLNLTQSAVSHQIRRLEQLVGRTLVARTTREVVLTDEGEAFLACGHRVLSALDELDRRFRRKVVSGIVRLGLPDSFLGTHLPDLLARFAARFPDVQLAVSVGMSLDLNGMVDAGELDLAVVMEVGDVPDGTLLRSEPLVWAAAETFRHIRPSLPLALYPPPCISRRVALDALARHGVAWHVAFTCPSPDGILASLQSGLAVTVLGRTELKPGVREVGRDLGLPPLPEGAFRLVCSTSSKSEAARELEHLIRHPFAGATNESGVL